MLFITFKGKIVRKRYGIPKIKIIKKVEIVIVNKYIKKYCKTNISSASFNSINRVKKTPKPILLLRDCHLIFQSEKFTDGFICLSTLKSKLCNYKFEKSNWNKYYDKAINEKSIKKLLGRFNIKPYHQASGDGYWIKDFVEPIKRYALEYITPSMSKNTKHPFSIGSYIMKEVNPERYYIQSSFFQKIPTKKSKGRYRLYDKQLEKSDPSYNTIEQSWNTNPTENKNPDPYYIKRLIKLTDEL